VVCDRALQRVAVCCRVLQRVTVSCKCCSVWQCMAVCCSVLMCVAVCVFTVYQQRLYARVCESMSMSVLAVYLESVGRYTTRLYMWCVAGRCSVLQCFAECCSALQYVAGCCSVWQCVAVCGSEWLCVAVCYSVLQRVAVYTLSVYRYNMQQSTQCVVVLQCVAVCYSVLQQTVHIYSIPPALVDTPLGGIRGTPVVK